MRPKPPWHLWVTGFVSLVWNSIGALDFYMTQTRNAAYLKGFTPAQLDYFRNFPVWAVGSWGTAVSAGVLGSLLLLFRKRQSIYAFVLSVACMVLTDLYSFVISDGLRVMGGPAALVLSSVILVVGVLLAAYARRMRARGVGT